ncbi:tRNA uridine-5-carboxymethylaminomethyl(34) synthesis GTPase MnmE [bacterium]|nr:tRNA uridine-5-carboxymethylaminomethyl(34) synthesis GTPase MnmE [bacterium]
MINKELTGVQCHDQETIISLCTPSGSGAIALLRISGIDAINIATKISKLSSLKKLTDLPSHTIHYGLVVDSFGQKIDNVLFLLMRGPKTFTGQNTVEITAHNNPFIINNIIESALQAGARLAQKGEFSKRAFLNKKIDLAQAEAIKEVIHAQSEAALKASLSQLDGSLSNEIQKIETDLLKALSFSEASFEFIEDDQTEFDTQISAIVNKTLKKITHLKKTFHNQKQIKEGVRIALLGSVNAGKSSLFNELLKQKRAIVTNIPGTTRDVIESGIYQNGTHITLIDTAGLRQTNDIIEQEGIFKSGLEATKADIIFLVYDGSKPMLSSEEKIYKKLISKYPNKIILIKNKTDIENKISDRFSKHKTISVSCKNKNGIKKIELLLQKRIKKLFEKFDSPFLLNQRQYNTLISLEQKLQPVMQLLQENVAYELVSFHLKESLLCTSEFSGKTINEKAIDDIFKTFCVGK